MIHKIIYHYLKTYCTVALWFYFRRWQIKKHAPIPDGPVIFVANHQNAFLDAILMICSTKRTPWSLTRANVFNKPLVKKFLTIIKMLPVYRFRDGFSTLRKNDEMIETCVNLLTNKGCLLIFGEGNHNDQYFLRPLQKGFARIALAAEEKNEWKLGVKIVTVGLQYDSHGDFRSRVLVSFGTPILVNEIINSPKITPENIELLIAKTEAAFKPLMLQINTDHYDNRLAYMQAHRQINTDLFAQMQADQALADMPDATEPTSEKPKQSIGKWFNPIYVYQHINHLIPRWILQWVLRTKVKDPQFIGSLKYALGFTLVPIFYLIQTAICYLISGSFLISILYFISLPLSLVLRRY